MTRRRFYFTCGAAPAGTTIVGAAANFTIGSGSLTVPANVTRSMVGIVVLATANGSAPNAAPVLPAGATWEKLDDQAATNLRVAIYAIRGVAAGDVITWTGTGNAYWTHIYTSDWEPIPNTLRAGTRGGVSGAATTSGSVTPDAGQRVLVVAVERTVATPTVVQSVAPATGETVTQITTGEDATTADSTYLGIYTAASSAARTTTITYDDASTNGYAAQVLLADRPSSLIYAGRH